MSLGSSFVNNDLVEVVASDVIALARVRDNSKGRLYIALEIGQYLPWVGEDIVVRRLSDAPIVCTARILHAGTATALLEIVTFADDVAGPATPAPSALADAPVAPVAMIASGTAYAMAPGAFALDDEEPLAPSDALPLIDESW